MDNNFIQINGIMSQGYGVLAKKVMRDKRLSIEAKAIYSYMVTFAGSGNSAFPSVELQLIELGISKSRYYKHRKQLEDLGLITIKQTREYKDGKNIASKNIYTLEMFPVEKINNSVCTQYKETEKTVENKGFTQIPQNETPQNETPHIETTENETPQNKDSNNNNINNNNINNNNINNNNINNNVIDFPTKENEIISYLNKKGFSNISTIVSDMKMLLENHSLEDIKEAIDITADKGIFSDKYILTILGSWRKHGKPKEKKTNKVALNDIDL